MPDRLPNFEQSMVRQDIAGRWRGAWDLMSKSIEGGGVTVRGVAHIFLKSVFAPNRFPQIEEFRPDLRVLAQKLAGISPYSSLNPSDSMLAAGEKRIIQRVLDLVPATTPRAIETVNELAQMSDLTLWTVGDYVETKHTLPQGLLDSQDSISGTGHQLWKLWKLGLTNREDLQISVSDNKVDRIVGNIANQERDGVKRFFVLDDRVENLRAVKRIIDIENHNRALTGDSPVNLDLVLVNQGSRRTVPASEIEKGGSLVGYSVIEKFAEAPAHIRAKADGKIGVFCDVDGVITDNTTVRKDWDEIAYQAVQEIVERARLVNPQKAKRGGEKLRVSDLNLSAIKEYIEAARQKGLRIGAKNGAYEVIQPGHIGGFDDAKDACDILIVLINSDASIQGYKSIKENVPRPLVNELQRADVLLGLEAVDGVLVFDGDPSDAIRSLKPDVYISSTEYEGKPLPEFDAAREVNADILYTNIRDGYSTSTVVGKILRGFLQVMEGRGVFTGAAAKLLKRSAGYG